MSARPRAAGPRAAARAIVLVAAGLLAAGPARGQGCCTPGTSPLGGLTGRPLAPGSFEFGLTADQYTLRQAYAGSERVADPAMRRSRVDRLLGWVRAGLPGEATLVVELPYDFRMREQPQPLGAPGEMFRLANAAYGDLSTSVLVRAMPRGRPAPWGVNLGAGVKWATGSVERTQGGLRYPVELQTGSGSNDPLLLVTAHRVWAGGAAMLAALTRLPRTGRNGYRYGTETHAVALAQRAAGSWAALGAELRVRAAAADDFRGFARANTGGTRWLAGPRARVEWPRRALALEGAALWPVRQRLNGLQIGVDREAIVTLQWAPR